MLVVRMCQASPLILTALTSMTSDTIMNVDPGEDDGNGNRRLMYLRQRQLIANDSGGCDGGRDEQIQRQ